MGANATVGPIELLSVHIEAPTDVRYQEGDDARLWFTVYNEGRRADVLRSVQSPYANAGEIRWDADCDGNATAVPALTFQPVEPNPAASRLGVPPFDAYHVQLVGLNRAVPAGTTIPVTFTFEDAGSVTVDAAVQPSTAVRPEPSNRCHEGPSVAPLAS
ncbi:copper chaperone PCu(A)C [Paractinoplanes hotanensis]|uniref:copper chaperone PCu(A)C n=1 Tax=Paractinoplanes hotanensis TaxID=2906497 RepID=UPI0034DB2593